MESCTYSINDSFNCTAYLFSAELVAATWFKATGWEVGQCAMCAIVALNNTGNRRIYTSKSVWLVVGSARF